MPRDCGRGFYSGAFAVPLRGQWSANLTTRDGLVSRTCSHDAETVSDEAAKSAHHVLSLGVFLFLCSTCTSVVITCPFSSRPTRAVRSLGRVSVFDHSILFSGWKEGCTVWRKNSEASMVALCAEYRFRGTLIAVWRLYVVEVTLLSEQPSVNAVRELSEERMLEVKQKEANVLRHA